MLMIFLSSGLFLGWSLGANDAANVFGTAVGSKMVRFRTAAIIASIFVVLGAVVGGGGAAHTLGKLGAVNAIAGSFMVAFSAGFTVFWMTKLEIPVSTSQAIVGAIIGWNLFSGSLTDYNSLTKILLTWILCPVLSAVIAAALFKVFKSYMDNMKIHMLRVDMHTRLGLLIVGAFGAYSLGANNIANVMGVFVPVAPFQGIDLGWISLSSTQILFFVGGLAIAAGIITYSRRVMETVGNSLMKISPIAAFVVVLAQAIVLFLFSSEGLENWLITNGLPPIPLVPVSSSQAVVGAVIGIGLVKGGKGIRYKVLGEIASGWVTTPLIAMVISFTSLFFLQNVFNQQVYQELSYNVSNEVVLYLQENDLDIAQLNDIKNKEFESALRLESALKENTQFSISQRVLIIESSIKQDFIVDEAILSTKIDRDWIGLERFSALKTLTGQQFIYKWQFIQAMENQSLDWKLKEKNKVNKLYNKGLTQKREYVVNLFKLDSIEND